MRLRQDADADASESAVVLLPNVYNTKGITFGG